MQRRRGVAHRYRVIRLATFGHRPFETLDGRPLGQPVGLQHVDHGFDIGLIEILPTVRDHFDSFACSAAICPTERKCGLVSDRYSNSSPTG
ncbi:hypothetical protein D3C71_1929580 [compost metagenome]